ncbi:MAG: ACT domain-containing protein [Roseibium sp.]|nr:ACT domain-containing protein [Roseibium sp.]
MSSQSHLVFTVIAQDRPGLVERLADAIASAGGNWVESSMARLGGEFAGIVSVDIETGSLADLHGHFDAMIADGIAITVRSDPQGAAASSGPKVHMDVMSRDHPGILRAVTQVLTAHGVSIDHLETTVVSGSMQGGDMFKATADLRLPDDLAPARLSEALEETAADLMADITLAD